MTKIIGLTGGIGSGKTTVAKYFAEKGIPVYIADDEAKKIMDSPEVIKEVQAIFDENVLTKKGLLDRKKIRNIVFHHNEKLEALNKIVHPKVKKDFENFVKEHQNAPFIIKEVAILFETNGHKLCDATILVTAPLETRIARVIERDNTTREKVLQIINNQLSEEEKEKLATHIIVNDNIQNTYKMVDILIKNLKIN
ncbi:dephospho-CoA kinase [Flavobacterium urocaniciphilum]|uniref:Dephospho-CoA kinase n=1 Tax=Flavobacterium urocaniciphilum TaxID=1299341 RepID=A0A1H9DB17_9FLAO|nr:dephospho-CoA kinase [Flavobacterium urocaniciphilum]SEQ10517.1 dephospho-CoA kinase [Flavobacterium urocaniciphilum]